MPNMDVRIISLQNSIARRQRVIDQLQVSSFTWSFFDAMRTLPVELQYSEFRSIAVKGRKLSSAELGVFGSHYSCLKQFLQTTYDFRLIAEDDVHFDLDFDYCGLTRLMAVANINYLRLYSHSLPSSVPVAKFGHRFLVRFKASPLGAQAYLITREGARKILDSIDIIDRPIDDHIDRFWVTGLPPYAIFPYPVLEVQMPSTVLTNNSRIKERQIAHKFVRVAGLGVDFLRRLLSNLQLRIADTFIKQAFQLADDATSQAACK